MTSKQHRVLITRSGAHNIMGNAGVNPTYPLGKLPIYKKIKVARLEVQTFRPIDHMIDLFLDQTFDQIWQVLIQPFP